MVRNAQLLIRRKNNHHGLILTGALLTAAMLPLTHLPTGDDF